MRQEAEISNPPAAFPAALAVPLPLARFTALQVASLTLPFAVALLFSVWIWNEVGVEARNTAVRTVELLHEQVARALEVQDASIAAVRTRIEGMSWDEIGASQEVSRLLERLDMAAPNTSRIGIIAPSGTLVQMSRIPPPGPRTEHNDRDFFQALTLPGPDRAMLGRPIIARTTGNMVLPYARPRLGPDGQSDGGLIWTTFLIPAFTAMFQRIVLNPDDTVLLLRTDGAVLARHPWRDPEATPPLAPDSPPMQALARAPAVAGQALLPSGAAAGHATGFSPNDGRHRLYTARRIPGVEAAVVYGYTLSAMRGEWLRRSLSLLAVATLSSALLLYLTHRTREAAARELLARDQARLAAEQRATAEAARADAEALLRQTQRVEMLGQIAAGVVHDFRNTVQTVHAGASLIERAAAQGNLERVREVADMLREAATRGGQLTQRLLAFRKGGTTPDASCNPAETVAATCALMHAALGPAFRLELVQTPGLPARVAGSQAELDSAVMNLVINARDAMPKGGGITIALRPASRPPGLKEGLYVELAVTDTGVGMDADTLARATDAFFTTKSTGGTGLGLSSIRGFVDGVGGTLRLHSAPGGGTTVTVWLPAPPP